MADPDVILGWRVELYLRDPDAGYAVKEPPEGWPRLTARLVRLVAGPYGEVGYLAELDTPLPSDFDPMRIWEMEGYGHDPITHLVLIPQANMPTADIPADFMAESLQGTGTCSALVLVGLPPDELPLRIKEDKVDDFRHLMDAEIRRIPEPATNDSES